MLLEHRMVQGDGKDLVGAERTIDRAVLVIAVDDVMEMAAFLIPEAAVE
jgi:hypothetical protein